MKLPGGYPGELCYITKHLDKNRILAFYCQAIFFSVGKFYFFGFKFCFFLLFANSKNFVHKCKKFVSGEEQTTQLQGNF